jgi:hypothetical protein
MGEIISTGTSSGVELQEYKGNYSLVLKNENNGKYWDVWAKYRKGKDLYQDKDWPVKVILGDKKTAIGVLQMLLKELQGADEQNQDDVPF